MRFVRRDAFVDAKRMPFDFKVQIGEDKHIRGKAGDYLVVDWQKNKSVVERLEFENLYRAADDEDPFSDELRKAIETPLDESESCVAPASDAELERQALLAKGVSA